MNYTNLDLSQKLTFINEAITVALADPTLTEPLSRFGVTPEFLNGGKTLHEEVEALDRAQQTEYGKRIQLTAQVDALYDNILRTLRKDRAIVLAVLKNTRGIDNQMGLKGPVKTRREGVLRQCRNLYNHILADADLRALLEPYNFSVETLQSRLADVETFAQAMTDQQYKRAESLIATRKRDEGMAQLDSWTAQFIGVARQVFRNDRQQLAKLGM